MRLRLRKGVELEVGKGIGLVVGKRGGLRVAKWERVKGWGKGGGLWVVK